LITMLWFSVHRSAHLIDHLAPGIALLDNEAQLFTVFGQDREAVGAEKTGFEIQEFLDLLGDDLKIVIPGIVG